ncbi:MAG: hypothetical protein EBR12_03270 [Proteobacteria bacterium]|nr:hypothetical protein [Pseudomonadota bacterium]
MPSSIATFFFAICKLPEILEFVFSILKTLDLFHLFVISFRGKILFCCRQICLFRSNVTRI